MADLNQDLDQKLNNKDLNGYRVKGWFYEQEKREFIVQVHDGDKWISGHAGSPLVSPATSVGMTAALILFDHSAPLPNVYIFKEGPRELFSVNHDTIRDTIREIIKVCQRIGE